jgi:hypothetical protein
LLSTKWTVDVNYNSRSIVHTWIMLLPNFWPIFW